MPRTPYNRYSQYLLDEHEKWERRNLRNRIALFLVCFIGAALSMLILPN